MFCRVEVLVKRDTEVSHYNTVPKPAVHLETAAGSLRLQEKVVERETRYYRLLVKKESYLLGPAWLVHFHCNPREYRGFELSGAPRGSTFPLAL